MTVYNLIRVLSTCPPDLKVYDQILTEINCIRRILDDNNEEIVIINDTNS